MAFDEGGKCGQFRHHIIYVNGVLVQGAEGVAVLDVVDDGPGLHGGRRRLPFLYPFERVVWQNGFLEILDSIQVMFRESLNITFC